MVFSETFTLLFAKHLIFRVFQLLPLVVLQANVASVQLEFLAYVSYNMLIMSLQKLNSMWVMNPHLLEKQLIALVAATLKNSSFSASMLCVYRF